MGFLTSCYKTGCTLYSNGLYNFYLENEIHFLNKVKTLNIISSYIFRNLLFIFYTELSLETSKWNSIKLDALYMLSKLFGNSKKNFFEIYLLIIRIYFFMPSTK